MHATSAEMADTLIEIDRTPSEEHVEHSAFEEDMATLIEVFRESFDARTVNAVRRSNVPMRGRAMERLHIASEMGAVMANHIFDAPESAQEIFDEFESLAPTKLEVAKGADKAALHRRIVRSHVSGLAVISDEEQKADAPLTMDPMLRIEAYKTALKHLLLHGLDVPKEKWRQRRHAIFNRVMSVLQAELPDITREDVDGETRLIIPEVVSVEDLATEIRSAVQGVARELTGKTR